jgi:hypothetical protein
MFTKKSGMLVLALVGILSISQAQYKSLDPTDPITFLGSRIVYDGKEIELGKRSFFIDGQLSDAEADKYPFVFNSVQSAVDQIQNGTEAEPMTLYLAPYVYWIDDPDDPAIRVPLEGDRSPYGMIIRCEWLRFYGLNKNPAHVILASNRGQTIGAKGNFTMFRFYGQGTSAENITFGNYCNVDLEFPLNPELNRKKRASAIVQAQLIHCDGDKIVARNTRFISRLNLCPFTFGKRVLFDGCHFESTDDALNGTAVYLNCTFDFHSSKPFYRTVGTGAVLLNCDVNVITQSVQYFTKANGQLVVIDSRFTGDEDLYIGWNTVPPKQKRNYQHQLTLNGKDLSIGAENANNTVDLKDKPLLDAYRLEMGDEVLYNTYNLLKGDDDWDPMNIRNQIKKEEIRLDKALTNIPTQLLVSPAYQKIETNQDTLILDTKLLRFGNYPAVGQEVNWTLEGEGASFANLVPMGSSKCMVIPLNNSLEPKDIVVQASTKSGLEAASVVTIDPRILPAPKVIGSPKIVVGKDGAASLDYQLDSSYEDRSIISWYRCSDKSGENPIEVATTKLDNPLRSYKLAPGDQGYYLMAAVRPRHLVSEVGEAVIAMTKKPIKAENIKADPNRITPDFSQISTANQEMVIPGFWTFRHLPNPDQQASGDAWFYGTGKDGAKGYSGLLQGRSGFMCYTPRDDKNGEMQVTLDIAPFKSAGQGFSVAPLHMDLLLNFDAESMSGHGLRIIRTTKYGTAVDFVFVKYTNGEVTEISAPITASCYRSVCSLSLETKGNLLIAKAHTSSNYNPGSYPAEVVGSVEMETVISETVSGGFGIYYNGGSSAVITNLMAVWK